MLCLRWPAKPRPAKPRAIKAQVDDSGATKLFGATAVVNSADIVPAEDAAKAVTQEQWQAVVDEALPPLARGEIEAALIGMADRCADLLAKPFPPGAPWVPPLRQRFHQV